MPNDTLTPGADPEPHDPAPSTNGALLSTSPDTSLVPYIPDPHKDYPVDYAHSTLSEEEMIEREYKALLYDYSHSNHRNKVDRIEKAFLFAKQAHKGVKRKSGEPYIMHPLAIARIVSREMGLGSTSIVCALLHDVVEDTAHTVEELRTLFGDKVAQIVDGLTKLPKMTELSAADSADKSAQMANMRKLLLTMTGDLRVILIKLADRLHNMRTMDSMKREKQIKISGETLYVYAPIAARLGLYAIKTELEEHCFRIEHPAEYKQISNSVEQSREQRERIFSHFVQPIKERIDSRGLSYKITSRVKSSYSIFKKMEKQEIPFEEVYDIFAVRIVFEPLPNTTEKEICFAIYSIITDLYQTNPKRLRDWVSTPKQNGYSALHCTAMSKEGQWIEVQIRSTKMDEIDERGLAAHWKYKNERVEEDKELAAMVDEITSILSDTTPEGMDALGMINLTLAADEVNVFTPAGDRKVFPKGASVLDFAYSIHADLGHHCAGAKVNHNMVPVSYRLRSGDQVEIITSQKQFPTEEWRHFVVTPKAKLRISKELGRMRNEMIARGEQLVLNAFRESELAVTAAQLDKMAASFKFSQREDFLYSVGSGNTLLPENITQMIKDVKRVTTGKKSFWKRLLSGLSDTNDHDEPWNAPAQTPHTDAPNTVDKRKPYLLLPDTYHPNYQTSTCCHPIPGDETVGFVLGEAVQVHLLNCPEAMRLKSTYGENIVQTKWGGNPEATFKITIRVEGLDSRGVILAISDAVSEDFNLAITRFNIEATDGLFVGNIDLLAHNSDEVLKLTNALKKKNGITRAFRIKLAGQAY